MSTRPGDAPSRPRLRRDRPAPPDPKQREASLGVGGCQRSQDKSREIRASLAGAGSLEPLAKGSAGGWRWQAVAGGGGGAGTEDAALTRRAGRLSVAQVWNGASGCRRAGSMEAKGSRSEPDRPWEGVPGGLANLKEPARMVKWKLLN